MAERSPSTQRERQSSDREAAKMIDWLLCEYVNAYSGIPVVWDQAQYDLACAIRERLEVSGETE